LVSLGIFYCTLVTDWFFSSCEFLISDHDLFMKCRITFPRQAWRISPMRRHNSDGNKGVLGDDDGEDGDSDVVDGPAVVSLAERVCKYYFKGYCLIHILTYICSAQNLS
jgi:hypothetical protein